MLNHSVGVRHRRRELLLAGAGAAIASVTNPGCGEPAANLPSTESHTGSSIPLRVAYCGRKTDESAILKAWAAVNPHPLAISMIELDRSEPTGLIGRVAAAVQKCDVVVYPLLVLAELQSRGSLTPFSDEEFALAEEQGGRFHTALRNGVARYGGRFVAAPLGAYQPALMSIDAVDAMNSWQDYDRWVLSLDGEAAEPLADGWAAAMFLWRAASTADRGWLFGRQNFEPQIANDTFQGVLTQMRETARRYKVKRSSPEEIWLGLTTGSLRGGLGFAFGGETGTEEVTFSDPPAEVLTKVVADPFSTVVSLSSKCRQSTVAKQFIRWISGGEGSESARRQVTGMTSTRSSAGASSNGMENADEGYNRWLRDRLSTANTLPTLQLLSAGEYYAVLDQQVIGCLEGQREPAAALTEVATRWREIGRRIGIEKQQRAWRRAEGMR